MNCNAPLAVILIGVPASGKSTFRNTGDMINLKVASSDDILDQIAKSSGKTYDEVFKNHINEAQKIFFDNIKKYVSNGDDFIVDRTNLTKISRQKILNLIPKHYNKIAIVFDTPDHDEWNRRLNGRPGKTIPKNVLQNMVENFEMPTEEEGFHKIVKMS